MVLGFAVILGVIGIYIASLVNRRRNLERDMELIDEIQAGEQAAADTSAAAAG